MDFGDQRMNKNTDMRVSVFMMAYNHEKFIGQAIESILMQNVDFEFDIVIGEDCSTDKTREIIVHYAQQHPDKIKLILHDKNVGAVANQVAIFNACSGKYIAFCEGDDYWIDPNKLQSQVDFMESHSDYVLIHSNILFVNNQGVEVSKLRSFLVSVLKAKKSGRITKQLVKANYIVTATVLMLADALFEAERRIVGYNDQIMNMDYAMFIELSALGKIHYQNTKTSAYRILTDSASHSSNLNARLRFIDTTINISRFYNSKFGIGIDPRYFDRIQLSAQLREYANRKLFSLFRSSFFNGIKSDPFNIFRVKNYIYLIITHIRS